MTATYIEFLCSLKSKNRKPSSSSEGVQIKLILKPLCQALLAVFMVGVWLVIRAVNTFVSEILL
jgi:hypothetical protein